MTILLTEINVRDAYQKYYHHIDQKVFEEIVAAAQPNEGTILLPNTKWVLGLYKKKPQETIRDLSLLNDCFQMFNRLKILGILTGRSADLNSYSSIRDLKDVIDRFNPADLEGDNADRKKRLMRPEFIEARNNIKKQYEDDRWLVITPLSYEASVFWGDGTDWCTAYKDSKHYYEDYTHRGPLYINIDKRYGDKYQFHFPSKSFMDQSDDEIERPIFDEIGATEGLKKFYRTITTESMYAYMAEEEAKGYELDEYLSGSFYVCHKNGDSDNLYDDWLYEYNLVDIDEDDNNQLLAFEGFESYDIIREMKCLRVYRDKVENIVLYSGGYVFDEWPDDINYNTENEIAIGYFIKEEKYEMFRIANYTSTYLNTFTFDKYIGGNYYLIRNQDDEMNVLDLFHCNMIFDEWIYYEDCSFNYIKKENSILMWIINDGIKKIDLDTNEIISYRLDNENITKVSFFSNEAFAIYLDDERKWKLYDVKSVTPKYNGKLFDDVICNHETKSYPLICYQGKWNIINLATGRFIFQDIWFDTIIPKAQLNRVSDRYGNVILFPASVDNKKYLISVDGNIYEYDEYKFGGYNLLSKKKFENVKLNLNDIQFILSEAKRLINEISVKDAYAHYQDTIPEDVYKWWVVTIQGDNADNTQLDSDTKWVLKRYENEGDSMFGKAEQIVNAINIFKRMRVRGMLPPGITLEQCSSIDELIAFTNSVNHDEVFARTQKELDRDIKAAKNDIDVVFENDEWYVLIPKSMEASIYWGSKTKWCTATKTIENNRFEQYSENGPLYININKKTGVKYQFSFADSEWNDASNEVIPFPIMNNIEGGETLAPFYQQLCTGHLEWAKKPMFEIDYQFTEGGWTYCDELDINCRKVIKDSKVNIITEGFRLLSDIWFDSIDEDYPNYGFSVVNIGDSYYYFDYTKGLNKDSFVYFGGFLPMGKYFFYATRPDMISIVAKNNEKFNLMNGNGKLLLNRWFDEINDDYENRCFIGKLNGEMFKIDNEGKVFKL